MFKVSINTCAYQDLRALPGIGQVITDRIWELKKEGHIDENIFATIPRLRLTRELLNFIEFSESSGIDDGYAKLSPDEKMGTYLEQAGYIDEGLLHIQDYEDQGEICDTPLKQSIGTTLLGPEVFSTDMPTHKATPLTEPRRTRPYETLHDFRTYSDSQLRERETNHRSSTHADLQNYRVRDTCEPVYCDQAATSFQQIKPYDDQQTRTSHFLKRQGGRRNMCKTRSGSDKLQ